MKYRFIVEAIDDLRETAAFYESRREGLGIEFTVERDIAIGVILDAPVRWPEIEPGIRKYRLDRFPIGIFYRIDHARELEIVAIFDLRRQSNSWKRRIP